MKKLKTGIIGKGYWGTILKKKIENITDLKFFEGSSIDYNILNQELDLVFICTPTETHYDIVKKCIEYKKNIFCEKPFTGCHKKATELINLCKKNNLSIYIDNIFLYRKESNILNKNFKNIEFIWNKNEKIIDDICNSLLYHDLYILLNLTEEEDWDIIDHQISNFDLYLKIKNNLKTAIFNYKRNLNYKEKNIILDKKLINYSNPQNDALSDTIDDIIFNNIDYEKNNTLTLKTLKLLNYIKTGNQC